MKKLTIKCPGCGTESTMTFMDPDFTGPFACWQCHGRFAVQVHGGQLKSCEPLSPAELQKLKEAEELKAKLRGGGLGKS